MTEGAAGADFGGRVAVVTGAARGIGLAYARDLARRGVAVALADLRAERVEEAAAQLTAAGLTVRPYAVDVADESSVRKLFGDVGRDLGRLDFLVNNAAVMLDLERP